MRDAGRRCETHPERTGCPRGVHRALDGRSAVAVQGLPLPHAHLAVALVDDDVSRLWLRTQWTKGLDRHGSSLAPNWYESPADVRICTREPVYRRLGFVDVRFLEELPAGVLPLLLDGEVVPVLPIAEVRRAHAPLAELLDRHEQRTAAAEGVVRSRHGPVRPDRSRHRRRRQPGLRQRGPRGHER